MSKYLSYLITVFGTSVPLTISMTLPAQALPEAQILEKLQQIPVFTITDKDKYLLQKAVGKAPNIRQYSPIYMERRDAQAFIDKLNKNGLTNGRLAQITSVPLSAIYKLQLEAEKKPNSLSFLLFPTEQQVIDARLLKGKPYQSNALYPVPLFMIAIKQDNKYVTVQENKLTPLFFDKSQAQQWLERVKKKDPQLVTKAEIKVNYLHVVIRDFQDKSYPAQQQLTLVPSTENVALIRQLQVKPNKPDTTPTTAATPSTVGRGTPEKVTAPSATTGATPNKVPTTSTTGVVITDKAPSTFITDVQKIVDLIN
jgi:Tic22-like family